MNLRFLSLAAILLLLAPPVSAQTRERARFAVVVGHNVGNHTTEDLAFAHKDADKVLELFQTLGNIPESNMVLVIAPDAGELRKAIETVRSRIASVSDMRSELFFYYSGHADDTGLQLGDTILPLAELKEFLRTSGADATIAIVDACYSGALVRSKGGKRVPIVDLTISEDGETTGLAIITSSSAGEKSQESDELRGSFFTHFLASGMRGDADSSGDGRVTLYELYQYAYNKTRKRTHATGANSQHPTFDYKMTGSGEIVVSYPKMGRSRLILPEDIEGNYLLYAPGTDTVLAEVDKRKGEIRVLAVPPGTIELFRRNDLSLHKTSITVKDGEEVVVPGGEMVKVSRTYLIDKGASPRLTLGAKAGYQFFWDSGIRQRDLLPAWLGGLEFRVRNLLGPHVIPFVEVLVGGGTASSSGADVVGPVAQSSAYLEVGGGFVFDLFPSSPFMLEIAPEVALFYTRQTLDNSKLDGPEKYWYLHVSPQASLLIGYEFIRRLSVGLQGKVGYLYFENSGNGHHLGFTEAYLAFTMKL